MRVREKVTLHFALPSTSCLSSLPIVLSSSSTGLKVLNASCPFQKASLTLSGVDAYLEGRLGLPSSLPLSKEEVLARIPVKPGESRKRGRRREIG